jgi:predicted DNA-binding protein with PD1-like motif
MYFSAEGKQGKTVIARLKPGYDLLQSLSELLIEHHIQAGYIPMLLGGLKNLKLISMTFGENEDHPRDIELEYRQPLEYFGCGTLAQVQGKPSLHIHLSAAQAGNKTISGHFVSGEIALLTEVVIVELTNVLMTRESDPEVYSLPLLSFGR